MEREASARPLSMRPPSAVPIPRTAAMMSAASRPITQQGLSGLRPTQTSGGGVNRIYRDKRYWMSVVQNQLNKMRDEMARIKKENDEFRMKALNLEDLKRQAQEHAKKIEEQQETLGVYNTALEMHLSKTKEQEIIAETERIKRQNEIKLKEIDNLYNEKIKLQEKVGRVKKDLEEEDRVMNSIIQQLSSEDREKYEAIVAENEKIIKGAAANQAKLKEYKDQIQRAKEIISQSSEKQELLQLSQTLQHLEAQKGELTGFLQNSLTPAQQREALLKQVKQDKADTETLLKLKTNLEEDLTMKTERLAELTRELDGKDNARLKKHRELRERGEHMDEFISTYEEKSNTTRNKVEFTRNQILVALEHIAGNIAELDLEEFGNVQIDSSEQSLEIWNKKCSLLSSQTDRLKSYKAKYEAEIDSLIQKRAKLLEEIEDYQDIDRKRDELEIEKVNLMEEDVVLKAKLESTQAAVFEMQRQKSDLVRRLEENPSYHEIVGLEKEIEAVGNKRSEAEEILKTQMANDVIIELNSHVNELLVRRNEQLIANLKSKRK